MRYQRRWASWQIGSSLLPSKKKSDIDEYLFLKVSFLIKQLLRIESQLNRIDRISSVAFGYTLQWLFENPLPRYGKSYSIREENVYTIDFIKLSARKLKVLAGKGGCPVYALRLCLQNWYDYGVGLKIVGSVKKPYHLTKLKSDPPPERHYV